MVYIRDDGVFDAPIDRIWKYLNDMEGNHRHGTILEMTPTEQKGNVVKLNAKTRLPDGKTVNEVWRMTMFPPDGWNFEILEGPRKGTINTYTYIPQGNKTKVIVSGEFKWGGADDETTRKLFLQYMESVFEEDNKTLKDYR
jgi:hypothetical protein